MKCKKCNADMVYLGYGEYKCHKCDYSAVEIGIQEEPSKVPSKVQIKTESPKPYVDDTGIWGPVTIRNSDHATWQYVKIISKELFVEAYNKWIRDA